MHNPVIVEWVDSSQPISGWHYLSEPPACETIQCCSVGWIVRETNKVLMLAPNIGDYESGGGAQGSGFIRIPKAAITRMAYLEEAMASACLLPHPDSKQTLPIF